MTLLCGAHQAVCAATPALMPLPVKAEAAPGGLTIDGSFSVLASGCSETRLQAAAIRLVERVSRQTGIPMRPAPSGSTHVSLLAKCAGSASAYPTLGEDESYTLDIAPEGARLQAATETGTLHGLETFAQLVAPGPTGFQAPAMHIEDRPRFPWRGLMLDVSRHWMPLEVVKRNLDAMASVKLNVFHWHLSDDQGFRVESKVFPKLHQAGSDGHYYTQDQIRDVIAYARDRGIRVVPEFDMPGHTNSWFPGYPELASAPGPYEIGRTFGIFDPTMDPSREETYAFLDRFIGEMAALFPDAYFHIGGDEVNGKQWTNSTTIQKFAREHGLANNAAIQTYFNQRIEKILEKHGKKMVGWDEVLHPDLPKGTVVQSWRGQAALADSASKGFYGILSWGYYLDHLRPASFHYAVDPLAGAAAQLPPDQAARILGGEACMWAELVDGETVDSRIWPRAAAVAERLWSPANVTDVASMYTRMEQVSRTLEWTGVQHRANYSPMLDRLAGGRPNQPLRVLADLCEGQGLGGRQAGARYTSLIPLNRFVDAARPESETVRSLEQAATRFGVDRPIPTGDLALLRETFALWVANDVRFQTLAEGNALLTELQPVSKNLAQLGAIGLQILDRMEGEFPAPQDWLSSQAAELARIEKPVAEVKLAAVRPVKLLLDALARRTH